jgi:hypothetical protein
MATTTEPSQLTEAMPAAGPATLEPTTPLPRSRVFEREQRVVLRGID